MTVRIGAVNSGARGIAMMSSAILLEPVGAVAGGDGDDRAFARSDLLDVVQVFREDGVVRRDEDRGQLRPDERDDAVFELGARMAFGEEIGDLFHLERRLRARPEN